MSTDAVSKSVDHLINSSYLDATSKDSNVSGNTKENSNELGKDAFLTLLMTQMQYQDPLSPMDNSQMLAQLAQFTALEQMQNVASVSTKQYANSLVGKYVDYTYKDSTTGEISDLSGKIDYVKTNGNDPVLGIGDKEIKLEDIYKVIDSNDVGTTTTAFSLMGKTVQGVLTEKDSSGTEISSVIEGEVVGVSMKDDKTYVNIGQGNDVIEVPFEKVQNIVEQTSITGKKATATMVNAQGQEESITGIVQYIKIKPEGTYVCINGKLVDFNDVTKIENN